ncbi:MAG: DUF4367 domain-containing protein [Acetobacter sp.]|nr:DUF4367 domain-containing protein [Bacteroides sp.]MCM1341901.1 DUF4367 domain-containing protein [Acetobacter sp.]MCM1434085.1 DUF4367 domain-containing protein [Clostridiales bacterium]
MENSKEQFIKAFLEAERIDNSKLKSEDEIEWDFSEKFEKSMNKLIKKNNHIKLSTRRHIRKGLLAAIIAIIVTFTGLMSVSATRAPFIEFVKKIFPQFNEITLSEESTPPVDKIETEYTLTNLPDGFEIKEYQKYELGILTTWINNNGDEITFSQNIIDTNFTIDNEHNYKELLINGYTAYYVEDKSGVFMRWTDGNYWFTLNVSNNLRNDIITLSKNISEKN